jgi:acetyltransferase-like isoleucine patch superfamily enzyme
MARDMTVNLDRIILKIKRREHWGTRLLYELAVRGRQIHCPYIPIVHDLLTAERRFRLLAWRHFKRIFYYEPLMRARCARVGKDFTIVQALPLITGNLEIHIGDHVTIDGTNTFAANRVYESPRLKIGDHTFIGWHVTISVAKEVTIGQHCLIGVNVLIADNDMHPLNSQDRRQNTAVPKEMIKPVIIGDDVWIGAGCFILKGVTIGNGAVIGSGSVVVHDVPPHSVAAGNPARVVKSLD